jgi:hypothetical protein
MAKKTAEAALNKLAIYAKLNLIKEDEDRPIVKKIKKEK